MNRYEQYNWLFERVQDFGIRVVKLDYHGRTYIGGKRYEDYLSASLAIRKALEAAKIAIPKRGSR